MSADSESRTCIAIITRARATRSRRAAISILDSVANPDYVNATTAAWNSNNESSEGYGKSVTIDGNPGFEAFEKDSKHSTLWVMIANRYFVQIELQDQDPKELQEWVERVEYKTSGDQVTAARASLPRGD